MRCRGEAGLARHRGMIVAAIQMMIFQYDAQQGKIYAPSMHPSSANTVLQVSVALLVSKAGNLNTQSEKHLKEDAILSML